MILHHQFMEVASLNSNKIAIFDRTLSKDFTYGEILVSSLMFERIISKFDNDRIGIMLPNSGLTVISIMGALMAGKSPAIINFSTGAISNSLYAQEKCGFKTIITSKMLLQKYELEPIDGMIFVEDILASFSPEDQEYALKRTQEGIKAVAQNDKDDVAIILFTSGSEREPKVVQLTHNNIASNARSCTETLKLNSDDIYMGILPFFHVFGLTTTLFLPLLSGGQIVAYANPLDFKAIVEMIKELKATVMFATPAFLMGYVARSQKGDFESLRIIIAGADKLGDKIRDQYLRIHNKTVLEGYGTTETSPVVSVNTQEFNKNGSIGRPLAGVEVKVVSIETGEELPVGHEGRLLVKGYLVMKGYLGESELTNKAIVDGWYDTGDIALIDIDGFIWHKGRLKRFLKIGGEMISLVLIESVASKFIDEGINICAVAKPHDLKGSEIVLVTSKIIDVDLLKSQIQEELPAIMIPKIFRVIEDFPMTGSGKVNFREIERLVNTLKAFT